MDDQTKRTERIRFLNDTLRSHHSGGSVTITAGIAQMHYKELSNIFATIAAFDAFSDDNDPYGEHDCASETIAGRKIMWKIDYYDPTMRTGSRDPADPNQTKRVMTVMLAEEY